jgi:hypothetical protein
MRFEAGGRGKGSGREGGCRTTAARMRTTQGPMGSVSQLAARSQEGLRGEQHRGVEGSATIGSEAEGGSGGLRLWEEVEAEVLGVCCRGLMRS